MAQNRFTEPQAVPRPTGEPKQDMDRLYTYLYELVGELHYRMQDIERRLRGLEQSQRKTGR